MPNTSVQIRECFQGRAHALLGIGKAARYKLTLSEIFFDLTLASPEYIPVCWKCLDQNLFVYMQSNYLFSLLKVGKMKLINLAAI